MSRRDLVRTTASVYYKGQLTYLGQFKTFSGGELQSANIKTVRGAGQIEEARGGRKTIGDVTISREDRGEVALSWLADMRGRARMAVHRVPLDLDLNPLNNRSLVYHGILMEVRPSEGDNEAEDDVDTFELIMSCDSEVTT